MAYKDKHPYYPTSPEAMAKKVEKLKALYSNPVNHPQWKGGRIKRSGYTYLKIKDHPYADKQGYIAEHRVVMEKHIGRHLTSLEAVHHINHDRSDNNIENLELFSTHGQHTKLRHPEVYEKARQASLGVKPSNYNRGNVICPTCNKSFETTLGSSGKVFCSRACCYESRKGIKPKNTDGLKLGRGWNKGKPMTWQKRGADNQNYKHGRYSKYA